MMSNMGFPGLLLMFVMIALVIVPFWKLWQRTGHSGAISLLMVVPVLNVVMLYVLAFKKWPIENDEI